MRTLAARVNLSPDSPTQMLRHNLRILTSRMGFLDLSFFTPSLAAGAAFAFYTK